MAKLMSPRLPFSHSDHSGQKREVIPVNQLLHPQAWIAKSERVRCHICSCEFGFFCAKHHCRMCGEVSCHACLVKKPIAPSMGGKSDAKICVQCVLSFRDSVHSHVATPLLVFTTQSFRNSMARQTKSIVRSFSDDPIPFEAIKGQDGWVPSTERSRCHICSRDFGVFRRKHHCRLCGEVVCSDCTMLERASLPMNGFTKVKVCATCYLANAEDRFPQDDLY